MQSISNFKLNPFYNYWSRSEFFGKSYIVGGYEFSLDSIRQYILPSATQKPYTEKDPRKQLQITKREYRIHSVLTCFNKSSPRPCIIYHDKVSISGFNLPTFVKVEWFLDQAAKHHFQQAIKFEDNCVCNNNSSLY